jgi:hypothetical protein
MTISGAEDAKRSQRIRSLALGLYLTGLPGCEDASWLIAQTDPLMDRDNKQAWLMACEHRVRS